ncbi:MULTISPECIES: YybH family protein [Sphingobacterium]|uniref:YybH family protein n=1 Tax=Sphingobacterium TaxID=28453 RepID=UPI001051C314|nr:MULTISPECIES: nuclear transport factor 2 family protein [Sphingobacterium]MCW2264035.1 ketosteroid isomerase-like protein [Sphingobacterium kitahiroshimense]TCR14979.1 hypothetical protein EDF67_1011086 [Sphingobacterium sp. JUb78]
MNNLEVSKNKAIDLIKNYGACLQSGNIDEILNLYCANAEIIPEAKPSLSSKMNIEAFYKETFETITINGDLIIKEINVFDNVALVRCEEPAEVKQLLNGKIEKAFFRELFVLIRANENQDWKIFKYMFSQIK